MLMNYGLSALSALSAICSIGFALLGLIRLWFSFRPLGGGCFMLRVDLLKRGLHCSGASLALAGMAQVLARLV